MQQPACDLNPLLTLFRQTITPDVILLFYMRLWQLNDGGVLAKRTCPEPQEVPITGLAIYWL
jgi:hypothetical protein